MRKEDRTESYTNTKEKRREEEGRQREESADKGIKKEGTVSRRKASVRK
jgi:hypothetical protein